MPTCIACRALVRNGAHFCTQCGAEFDPTPNSSPSPLALANVPLTVPPASPVSPVSRQAAPEPGPEPEPHVPQPAAIPARIAPRVHSRPPAARSTAATWSLVTGVAPLVLSVIGNLIAAELGVAALARSATGNPHAEWATVLVVLSVMFVGNAALMIFCGITGARAIRETANGVTRGRALAVAGLAAGGVNLVLWIAGLIVTVSGLNAVFS